MKIWPSFRLRCLKSSGGNEQLSCIRYIKLHFTIRFLEDSVAPKYKTSALRGGMGEMLLRANCIRNRECESCDFERECLVRRILYSKMEIQPPFMTKGDSVGYVLECENYQTDFQAGDEIKFNLILFGKTIVYFSQILNAFYALGQMGLGRERSRFEIVSVTNTKGTPILQNENVEMRYYQVETVEDYVNYRLQKQQKTEAPFIIKFQSPLTLKYQGVYLKEFQMEALYEAIRRRIYMLDCFEGIEGEQENERPRLPEIVRQEHHQAEMPRYSNHQQNKMILRGIEGWIEIEEPSEDLKKLLLSGELIHIGKNTSFGFGRYRIV